MNRTAAFFAISFLVSNLWSQNTPDLAAKDGFQTVLEIASTDQNAFPQLTKEISLGSAIRFHSKDTESTPQFFYGINSSEGLVMLLRVVQSKGEWNVQELGFESLAREISLIQQAWPQESGYNIEITLDSSDKTFHFSIPESKKANLTPIHFGATNSKPATKYSKLNFTKEN